LRPHKTRRKINFTGGGKINFPPGLRSGADPRRAPDVTIVSTENMICDLIASTFFFASTASMWFLAAMAYAEPTLMMARSHAVARARTWSRKALRCELARC
jgi:hypothetical protein